MSLKEAKRIWKFSLTYFLLTLAEFGVWYSLQFLVKPKWFGISPIFWLPVSLILIYFVMSHSSTFIVLFATPLICCWKEYLDKKKELQKRICIIDKEFSEFFWTPDKDIKRH